MENIEIERIIGAFLSLSILCFIFYRWIKLNKILSNINLEIETYFRNNNIEVISIRELDGFEKLKYKLTLLGSTSKAFNIFSSLEKGFYRVVKLKEDSDKIVFKIIDITFNKGKLIELKYID